VILPSLAAKFVFAVDPSINESHDRLSLSGRNINIDMGMGQATGRP
jgi:hypothetical protein